MWRPRAVEAFRNGQRVDVVVDQDGNVQAVLDELRQRQLLPADHGCGDETLVLRVDDARHAHPDSPRSRDFEFDAPIHRSSRFPIS